MTLLQTLSARYDDAVLTPPEPFAGAAATPQPHDLKAWQALQAWCAAGSGPGGSPWLQPGALPRVDRRFAIATLQGSDEASAAVLARWLCLERDGSLQLLACRGAAGRIALRLKTKLHDLMWWRRRAPGDAWDSGTLRTGAQALAALQVFQPRRATLIVAAGLDHGTLQAVVARLGARSAAYAHPVRLLLLNAPAISGDTAVIRCT